MGLAIEWTLYKRGSKIDGGTIRGASKGHFRRVNGSFDFYTWLKNGSGRRPYVRKPRNSTEEKQFMRWLELLPIRYRSGDVSAIEAIATLKIVVELRRRFRIIHVTNAESVRMLSHMIADMYHKAPPQEYSVFFLAIEAQRYAQHHHLMWRGI